MLINRIVAHHTELDLDGCKVDYLPLEWYELSKRVQRKTTTSGREVALKFMGENVALKEGDILYYSPEEGDAIMVEIIPVKSIVITPTTMLEMATVCYEIGNKHMPLFIDGADILLPYEAPMFKWVESAGFNPTEQYRKLSQRLKSSGGSHHHSHGEHHHHDNLFTKVVNFATKKG
ncbi:MAG: urease accessory protein UreE [Rikenellaceae bacterium]